MLSIEHTVNTVNADVAMRVAVRNFLWLCMALKSPKPAGGERGDLHSSRGNHPIAVLLFFSKKEEASHCRYTRDLTLNQPSTG